MNIFTSKQKVVAFVTLAIAFFVVISVLEGRTMAEENSHQGGAGSSSSATPSQSVNPNSKPETTAETDAALRSEVKEIPIGMPMSPEEFQRRKQNAQQPDPQNQAVQSDED